MLRERSKIAMLMAEFLGTGVLTMAVLAATSQVGNSYFVALAAGLAVAAMVLIFGNISGAHINPAITLGLLSARRIKLMPALAYVAMQLLGAVAAYLLYTYFTNQQWNNSGTFDSRVLVAEAAGAFVLSIAVAAAVYQKFEAGKAAAVIGIGVALGVLAATVAGEGIINPAVALGVRSWVWATYVLGPVLGAVIGFNLYALLFAPADTLAHDEKAAKASKKS